MKKNKNMLNGYTTTPVILSGHTSPSVILSGREGSMDSSANAFRMTTEGGRSMVEMLGVLAIIGVLSVGGIAGYTMAMNKYKANEIVNGISTMYMLGMSANKGQGSTTDMLYSTTVSTKVPTGASEITYKTDKTVVAAITDTGVCDQVKNQLGDKAEGECSALKVTLGDAGVGSAKPTEDACTGIGGTLVSDGNYCLVESDMTWKSAYELCNSPGMHGMVSLSDFSCEEVGGENECPAVKGDDDLKSTYFWTFDCYDQTCTDNKLTNMTSGRAYGVYRGLVHGFNRNGDYIPALCK